MKTFSELLDTDPKIVIKISLSPVGIPNVLLKFGDIAVHDGTFNSSRTFEQVCNLLDPIDISITLSGKEYNATSETAVVIDQISIDNFNIVPNYTGYATYENERNVSGPTSYLGFNGTWRLQINKPFYHWTHAVTGQGWLLTP